LKEKENLQRNSFLDNNLAKDSKGHMLLKYLINFNELNNSFN